MRRARTWSRASARRSRCRRCKRRCRRPSRCSSRRWRTLEEHYRDMQDIEFTVEDDELYLLQTRAAKRTAAAALKAAAEMAGEGLITRELRPSARIEPASLDQLLHPMIDPKAALDVVAKGLNASPGAASGGIVFDADRGRRAGAERPRDPRPLRNDARRHPRHDRRAGNSDRARRDDLACGGCGARDGQAVRRRLRGPGDRRGSENGAARRAGARRGRRDHDRRWHGPCVHRGGAAGAAAAERGFRDDPRLGGRDPASPDSRERGYAVGCVAGA